MANLDKLEIEILSDEQIKKLETAKKLLTDIKTLKEEIFGNI